MVEISRDWIISDSIKLIMLFVEIILTGLYLLSPCRDPMKRRLQWMQLVACVVGFVSVSCAHGLFFSSWRTLLISETTLLIVIGLQDISIANMLNIQKNLVVKNRKLKSYGTWYIVVALLFVISQIIGALAVLITDRITETTLLSYAGRVLFLVVFDWAVFRRAYVVAAFVLNIRKVTTARSSMNRHRSASMLERESLDEYEERMTQPSTIYMPRLMFRLKLFVASSLIGFLVAVSAGSILMYRSVSSHQNSAVYSRTYQDDRKDFNLYVDFGVFLVLLLMTSNLLFSRVDIDWKAFGCGVFFVTDKGTEMKTGGDRSSVLWSKESKDIGTAIDDASDVFEVLEDFASG
mmetsp:Transcript_19791/g.27485  ORF Transcript_19791/g.27485 Transcript_19791/m.27485 type:complete len:349 (+) Transcript_19791:71-1117(+)